MSAVKNDDKKPQLDLLPYDSLVEITRVLEFGAKKYGVDNWKNNLAIRRLINATLRHVMEFSEGIDIDSESGMSHIAHAGCNILFILWLMKHGDCDNRRK